MTYQAYPTGGGSNQMAERPTEQPSSLRTAVRLMWAGAALSLIGVIITLAFSSRIKTAITNAAIKANKTAASQHKTQLTASQIHTLANATFAILVVFGIIGVLLWVWMAWANNKGSSWARIVATVLFALNTIGLIFEVGRASVSLISILLEWLVGVGAIILLWRRETTQFINAGRMR
jgi:ABC-type transport system involved in cytochrome bd biosynthesis fused ATPase/permease subunit